MSSIFKTKRSAWSMLSLTLAVIFLGQVILWARPRPGPPPRRPLPPRRPGGARVAAPRPGPRRRPPRARFKRRGRYWHPYYAHVPPRTKWIWKNIGYPYYVGGAEYVIVTSSEPAATTVVTTDTETTAVSAADSKETETDQRYQEIQTLADLIHEWRVMNEAPQTHQRLPDENASAERLAILAKIKTENEIFDQDTRRGMLELAQGNSAQDQLEAAQTHLEKLAELFETLPEPKMTSSGDKTN